MNLEDRLRRALRRVEPGEDFADRVLARLDEAGTGTETAPLTGALRATHAIPRWALAASVVLALGLAAMAGHGAWLARTQQLERQRLQARNESASRQLVFALDLTSRELEIVHRHLDRKTEETGS